VTKLVYRELPTATQNYANRRKTDAYSGSSHITAVMMW